MLGGSQDLFQMRSLKRAIQREQKRNFPIPIRFNWRWCPLGVHVDSVILKRFLCQEKREKYYFVIIKRANILGYRGECILPKSAIKTNCIFHMDIQKENPASNTGNRVL